MNYLCIFRQFEKGICCTTAECGTYYRYAYGDWAQITEAEAKYAFRVYGSKIPEFILNCPDAPFNSSPDDLSVASAASTSGN